MDINNISMNPKIIKMKNVWISEGESLNLLFHYEGEITTEFLAFPIFEIVGKNGPADPVRLQKCSMFNIFPYSL